MERLVNEDGLPRLQTICLAYPDVVEDFGGVGAPTLKVRGKIFAMQHPHEGRPSLWCKAEREFQPVLVASDPARFFVPPYVGRHGWVGVWLDVDPDGSQLEDLIATSYRMTAPKRLLKLIGQ